jgi:phospholipid transport system substrate-binding protein
MTDIANAAQHTHWNEVAGPKWVGLGDVMETRMQNVSELLLANVGAMAGDVILDIGCGTGTTRLPLPAAVGAQGHVVGIDISAPMLAVAQRRVADQGLTNVSLLQADAQVHRFTLARFDRLVSRFGVMFFVDPVAAFRNLYDAARPGGRLCFVCWAPLAENPHWQARRRTSPLTRRQSCSLALASAAVSLTGVFPAAHAQGTLSAQQATQFVQQTGQELVGVVNGSGSPAEKQRQLQPLIDGTVDVNGVGRFALGRFWRLASAQQQREFLQLFHAVLLNSVTNKLGAYQGVSFTVERAKQVDEQVQVWTTVIRPNNPPNQVIWVIEVIDSKPKIVDIIAEGTSLRLTQRADYASYLSRNNNDIQRLIEALRRQIAEG